MLVQKIAAFTRNGAGGNPAGVVIVDRLPPEQEMQRVAREVGYSETVFSAPSEGHWVTRYFSPEMEVPFCGHATIALGAALAQQYGDGAFKLAIKSGMIEVSGQQTDGSISCILRSPPTRHASVDPSTKAELLQLFGYGDDELDPSIPLCRINAGANHFLLPLKARDALSRMAYDLGDGQSFMQKKNVVTVALVWRETDTVFHARNAFASSGIFEDPATGAAAAAFAGMMRDQHRTSGNSLVVIQGEDMGHPSEILVRFTDAVGSPVFVAGTTRHIP